MIYYIILDVQFSRIRTNWGITNFYTCYLWGLYTPTYTIFHAELLRADRNEQNKRNCIKIFGAACLLHKTINSSFKNQTGRMKILIIDFLVMLFCFSVATTTAISTIQPLSTTSIDNEHFQSCPVANLHYYCRQMKISLEIMRHRDQEVYNRWWSAVIHCSAYIRVYFPRTMEIVFICV